MATMKCQRCDNFATEHIAIREGGKTRELHLCESCANAEADIVEIRQRARLNTSRGRSVIVHDFVRQWEGLRRSFGRELSKSELIGLLDRLCD